MAIIKKKTWPDLFNEIKSGKKKIDLRLADFDIEEGDILVLQEWDPQTGQYTGREIRKKVKYILKFSLNDFGQKDKIEEKGLYVIQF